MLKQLITLAGPLGLAGVIFILDRATKLWRFDLPPEPYPWPGVIELTRHMNPGLIANISIPRIPVIIFTGTLAAALLLLLIRHVRSKTTGAYALAIVLGGALGNIYDRVAYGYVFDWIVFFDTSVLNLADLSVTLGVLWYALVWQKREKLDDAIKTP